MTSSDLIAFQCHLSCCLHIELRITVIEQARSDTESNPRLWQPTHYLLMAILQMDLDRPQLSEWTEKWVDKLQVNL